VVGTVKFEARIRKLVENLSDLAILIEPLLTIRRVLREQIRERPNRRAPSCSAAFWPSFGTMTCAGV
jgi:hypothetical protein